MISTVRDIVIWDPLVRLFHWSTALLFTLNMTVLDDDSQWHEYAGYTLAGLVTIRIVWGFIGPRHARFSNFWPSRPGIRRHLAALIRRRIDPTEGHNPLGGLMVLALLASLLLTGLTGWMQSWDLFWGEEIVEEIHETMANLTLLLVGIHVSAVVLLQKLIGLELIRPMLTGKRQLKGQHLSD